MTRSERAFTLLEVLAAVALLGILYIRLAGVGVQWIRSEGENKRLLEASLLADQQLSEIELQIDGGSVPEVGTSESEFDEFLVSVNVEPYALPAAPSTPGEGDDDESPLNLTSTASGSEQSPLRAIELRVTWNDGARDRSVVRHTYAFDTESVAGLLGALSEQDPNQEALDQLPEDLREQVKGLLE
jgi:prepilin-type N-terminal cleavage/methylation domain-containing protein